MCKLCIFNLRISKWWHLSLERFFSPFIIDSISPIQRHHYITSSYTYQFFEKSYILFHIAVSLCACRHSNEDFFESPRPSLAKEESTFSPSPSSSGSGDVTALRCSEPLRYRVGGPSEVFAMVVRDGTAWEWHAD